MSHGTRRRRERTGRRRPLVHAAVASAVLLAATAGTTVYVKAQAHDATALVSKVAAATGGSVTPSPSPTVDRDDRLAEAVRSAADGHDGDVSVAVLDVTDGASATYASGDGTYDTASIVKVDVLAALLLQAQDDGRTLTAQEKTYATAMIEKSDNAATTALWDAIGTADGLDAANERLGLTSTTGGDGPLWGLTQTTADDQLALLKQVFGVGDTGDTGDSALSAASQAYVQELMGNVESDQAWGVSAAGSAGAELKNGWLQRSTTGLWDINSVGRVSVDGKQYLVAVLSNGQVTKDAGISLVEDVAKAAVQALSDDG
ncbi:serine hydrolase [Streptomyces sp. NPDC102467]|uniref:serine hydrolase n=1 Tax=Streptomyces sp. NPDC102467 TaxID=3366179 RepID=UPI0038130B1D